LETREQTPSLWHRLVEEKIGRRTLLKGLAAGTAAATTLAAPLDLRRSGQPGASFAVALQSAVAAGLEAPAQRPLANPRLLFQPIGPTVADELVLPEGYSYQVVAAWQDEIGNGQTVGYNHDWVGYYPIDLLEKGMDVQNVHLGFLPSDSSSEEGLLVINHEYVNPLFVAGYDGNDETAVLTPEMVALEQDAVGIAVIHIMRNAEGAWEIVPDAPENRRFTALTPMVLTGPAAEIDGGPEVIGTVANCSGGMTPWGTALSCEENFQDYPLEAPEGYGWDPEVYGKRHYGWVVEVDPFDPESTARKHTAMGRMRHENVAVRVSEDGTVVAYMGDDLADSCVYKFVAGKKLTDPADRAANLTILESGRLYVANFGRGEWILLDYDEQTDLQEAVDEEDNLLFTSQADVLADVRAAAIALGATPMDRPEDIEIHPLDGSVYIALTNNTRHGNFHGQIVRLMETGNDPAATTFGWSIFAVGGPQSGFSAPDNLIFDGEGNLWMVTDISSSSQNTGIFQFQGNNGLFFFRTEGPYAGVAYQFASGPIECEMTGPAWTPDGKTLFLSIQHPGELTEVADEPTSRWPNGGTDLPRPATVAITGFGAI
jgi:secreted PhoX family phosphatase